MTEADEALKVKTFLRDRVLIGDGCWEWQGPAFHNDGYGHMSIGDRARLVHRVAYERWVGRIPEGLQIDHLCRNPRCSRPDHLDPVTSRINTLRGEGITAANVRRARCPRGHELSQ